MIFIFAKVLQINKNIKLIRELSGKKQGEFAKLIKTNLSNLKTYENSSVRPKANVLAAICDYAGITAEDLINRQLTHKDIKLPVDKVEGNGQPAPDLPADTKALYERWLADKDRTQQQFHATNQGLIDLLKNKLDEIATNLMTGQLQLKEQLFVVGEGLGQQLDGISEGLAAANKKTAKKDTNVSAQQRDGDGKGKSR